MLYSVLCFQSYSTQQNLYPFLLRENKRHRHEILTQYVEWCQFVFQRFILKIWPIRLKIKSPSKFQSTTSVMRDIKPSRSKCCDGKSISLWQGWRKIHCSEAGDRTRAAASHVWPGRSGRLPRCSVLRSAHRIDNANTFTRICIVQAFILYHLMRLMHGDQPGIVS